MKKMVSLLLAAVLAAGTLSACKKNDPEPAESSQPEPEQIYQDGDYPVSYTVPALDRTMDFITLSIKDGQIEISDYGCREDNSIPADSANEGSTSSDAALPSVPETASSEAASSEAAASGHEGATEYEMKALKPAIPRKLSLANMLTATMKRSCLNLTQQAGRNIFA